MSSFIKDKKKGDKYETIVHNHLAKFAKKEDWELKTAEDVLGPSVYRYEDLCYPDFTLYKKDGNIVFIDAKIKRGYPDTTGIYVAIERKFYDSYLKLMEMTNASHALVYMHCELTGKDYKIDLKATPFKIHIFDNKFNPKKEPSRKYYVSDMEEIILND